MGLDKLLRKKKAAIVRRWFDVVVDTYPADTRRFLKSQQDPFANPVGRTTMTGLKHLYDGIVEGMDRETAATHLDPIIRIRAVQDFTPAMAVAFVLDLKNVVKSVCKEELQQGDALPEWLRFEHRVDALALTGFDIYMSCREKIFQLKADNERTRVMQTFARAGLLKIEPEADSVSGAK